MHHQKSLYRLFLLSCNCLLIAHSSILSPLVKADTSKKSSISQILTLPNRGAPGTRRAGAASRNLCDRSEPLTALVPGTNFGLTSKERPTFWFYVPYTTGIAGEFLLTDASGKEVYRRTVIVSGTPGIISINLPKTASPLEVDGRYTWNFSAICQKETFLVQGEVIRVTLADEINRQLETVTAKERLFILAENGLWFDLVTEFIYLLPNSSQDTDLQQEWVTLWHKVDLVYIASKSLTSCCTFK